VGPRVQVELFTSSVHVLCFPFGIMVMLAMPSWCSTGATHCLRGRRAWRSVIGNEGAIYMAFVGLARIGIAMQINYEIFEMSKQYFALCNCHYRQAGSAAGNHSFRLCRQAEGPARRFDFGHGRHFDGGVRASRLKEGLQWRWPEQP
jgi:hypothetical protein